MQTVCWQDLLGESRRCNQGGQRRQEVHSQVTSLVGHWHNVRTFIKCPWGCCIPRLQLSNNPAALDVAQKRPYILEKANTHILVKRCKRGVFKTQLTKKHLYATIHVIPRHFREGNNAWLRLLQTGALDCQTLPFLCPAYWKVPALYEVPAQKPHSKWATRFLNVYRANWGHTIILLKVNTWGLLLIVKIVLNLYWNNTSVSPPFTEKDNDFR